MSAQPVRILQVVGSMNRGGTETWLMHVLRHIDPKEFEFTFLIFSDQPSAFEGEILALGAKIERIVEPRKLHRFAPSLASLISRNQYAIVHSHVHLFSGIVLSIAAAAGCGGRIAHAHTDTHTIDAHSNPVRRTYVAAMKKAVRMSMSHGIAVSTAAGQYLFGTHFGQDKRVQVVHCGIDLDEFRAVTNLAGTKSQIGVPENARVIGHAGRMEAVKNHQFLVEIASLAMRDDPNIWLLLLGDGSLRPAIEQRVKELKIASRTVMPGIRTDVPRLMMGAMDVFLLPSQIEGLPLSIMEAQAAGLRGITSDAVPDEAIVDKSLVSRLSLQRPASEWVTDVHTALAKPKPSQADTLAKLAASSFNVQRSAQRLLGLYGSLAPSSRQ